MAKAKTSKKTRKSASKVSKSMCVDGISYTHPLKPHPILARYLGYCISKSTVRLRKALEDEYLKLGLLIPHTGILNILSQSEPLNQLALGDELGMDKASMVKMIDGAERMGLVKRKTHAEDRRAKTVEITAKGRAMLPKIQAARERVEGEFLSVLSKSEAEALLILLRKVLLRENYQA